MIKVKIIGNDIEDELEKEINMFIKDKDIIDIKYTQSVQVMNMYIIILVL